MALWAAKVAIWVPVGGSLGRTGCHLGPCRPSLAGLGATVAPFGTKASHEGIELEEKGWTSMPEARKIGAQSDGKTIPKSFLYGLMENVVFTKENNAFCRLEDRKSVV